jgi:hypothetical protein
MRYRHADIEGHERFLIDFGLERVHTEDKKRWYAGRGPDPYVYVAEEVSRMEGVGGAHFC